MIAHRVPARDDALAVAPLILLAVPSLEAAVGERGAAFRAAEAAFRADRSLFAHRFGLVAESGDSVPGYA
ncbi:MAG: hypothetical protein M3245_02105, partial [Actinomycetota bacterium]|nr:hypothetical protein [Actinomycetota bacterium]